MFTKTRQIFLLLPLVFTISISAEVLVNAIGCEWKSKNGSFLLNRYVLFYKANQSAETYTKLCVDEINSSKLEPLTCYEYVFTDANVIQGNDWNTSEYWKVKIYRSSLGAYFQPGSETHYRCNKSPNPQTTYNFILNSKKAQLDKNQL